MANWYCVNDGFPANRVPVIGLVGVERHYKTGDITRWKYFCVVRRHEGLPTRRRGWQNWDIYIGSGWHYLIGEQRTKNFMEYTTVTHWAEIPPIPEGLL